MVAFADQPLAELLASVAAPRPAPGGGCAAAWSCALGAGLVEMAAAIGRDSAPERMQARMARAAELRAVALALAERDVEAYAAVLASPPGEDAAGTVLAAAADPPLAVAEAAAEVAELAADVARDGKESLRGDAITGAVIAEAATAAAAALVEINLAARPGDARLLLARAHARRAATARAAVLR